MVGLIDIGKENTMNELERVREEVAKWVFLPLCGVPDELDIEWDFCGENMQQNCRYIATQILSLKGIRIECDDQNLPELNLPTLSGNKALEITMTSFAKSIQNSMLKPDSEGNHWVQARPKEAK